MEGGSGDRLIQIVVVHFFLIAYNIYIYIHIIIYHHIRLDVQFQRLCRIFSMKA